MGKKTKTLADMKHEEIDLEASKPLWEVNYKNFSFVAYKNSFYGDREILSCYIFRDDVLVEHSGRTIYFTEDKALEELKWKYKRYLQDEVVGILLKQKAKKVIVPPNEHNEPYIDIQIYYDDITKEQWEKVKEFFDL